MCGIFLIDFLRNGYKCVSVSCNNRAIILHLKVSERGPRIVSIDELGTVLDGPKHEDVAFNCGVFLPILLGLMVANVSTFCDTAIIFIPRFWETGLRHLDKWI